MNTADPEITNEFTLDIDFNKPLMCQMAYSSGDQPCIREAAWRHIVACGACGGRSPVLVCNDCHNLLLKIIKTRVKCAWCSHPETYMYFHIRMEKL